MLFWPDSQPANFGELKALQRGKRTSNDLYEILTTKTRLVCATFSTKNIENRPCIKK